MTTAERSPTAPTEVRPDPPGSPRSRRGAQALLAAGRPEVGVWLGVLLCAAGLVLIVLTWGRVAALTNVALQVPYVISAGLPGLGLVILGIAVLNLSVQRQIAQQRSAQLRELRQLLADLRHTADQGER